MGDVIKFNPESWLNMRFLMDNIKDMRQTNEDGKFDIALRKQSAMYKEFIEEYRTFH